jgi:Zn-dependent membrane protease YugP
MLLILAVVLGLAVLPQMWVRRVIAEHSHDRADIAGTGGEFARHLLDEMKLDHVQVEETNLGDHYDPDAKVIRLLPQHMNGRSLAAIVIAAHETGHAMQDATGYQPLQARTRLAKQAVRME